MPNSPRMTWPFPAEFQDPWYDAFVGLVNAIDTSGYAAREDRNIVLMGGGTISFTAATGLLTWSRALQLLDAPTGLLWQAVGPGSITLQDGEIFYLDLVRGTQSNLDLTPQQSMLVPSTDQACLVAIRRGTRVYFRCGAVAIDGLPGDIIENPGGGGGGGALTPGFDKFLGDGINNVFTLSNLVAPARFAGVLVHRNGLLLDQVPFPATIDEYYPSNPGPLTVVTIGAIPAVTDRIFVTYWY